MNKKTCDKCNCNCHCGEPLHIHHYDKDLCACDDCGCSKVKVEDSTYENNSGLVIDDTIECESCQ